MILLLLEVFLLLAFSLSPVCHWKIVIKQSDERLYTQRFVVYEKSANHARIHQITSKSARQEARAATFEAKKSVPICKIGSRLSKVRCYTSDKVLRAPPPFLTKIVYEIIGNNLKMFWFFKNIFILLLQRGEKGCFRLLAVVPVCIQCVSK